MAVCKSCGAELLEGAAFCMKCGSKVETESVCPNCGEKLMEGAAFCMKCGTKVIADDIPATNDSVPEEIMPLIINVNDDEYEVTFWVKDESKVKENKYEDFIALIKKPYNDLYFIAEPFSEHNTLFYGVYVDWDEDNEVPDDEDFDNKCVQYLLEYHNRGKQVSINEIYFESQNGKTTEEELTDVIALCCMDGVEEDDHTNGCELFKFDEDYFDDAHLEYLEKLYQQEDLLEDKSEEQSDSAAPVQESEGKAVENKDKETETTPEAADSRPLSQLDGKTVFTSYDYDTSSFGLIGSSYSVEGKTITFTCNKITNESDWDTASLLLSFWLCPEANGDELVDCDDNVHGSRIASFDYAPLKKGCHYPNVKKSFNIPDSIKTGKYYIVVTMEEYGAPDGEVSPYSGSWWDLDKILDYKTAAPAPVEKTSAPAAPNTQWQKGIVKYKHLYIVDGYNLILGKVKNCECCKKPFTGIKKTGKWSLENFTGCYVEYSGFTSNKVLHFCSTDCAKKWIDTDGAKHHDIWAEGRRPKNIQEIF